MQYTSKPAQFRLPPWAHEFLAQEAASTGTSKTEVVLDALDEYRRKRLDVLLAEGYQEWAQDNAAEAKEWDVALQDGLEPEQW